MALSPTFLLYFLGSAGKAQHRGRQDAGVPYGITPVTGALEVRLFDLL